MKYFGILILSFVMSLPALAALEAGTSLENVKLEDQFGAEVSVPSDLKTIVFVSEKAVSKIVTEYIEENKVNLVAKNMLYVSDISGMPSMITKMIALPRMRKLEFKMALDREGKITKDWPREAGKMALITLNSQKVASVKFLTTKEELKAALQ